MADTPGMQEALQIPLHPNLTGEDASVKQLFGKGEDEPFTSEDVLALEELLKSTNGGQLPEKTRLAIQRAKAMFHRREENEKKFAENPQSFIQGVQEKATSLIETDPQKRAQLQAKAAQDMQEARAAVVVEQIGLKQKLRDEDQLTISWPAKPRPLTTRGAEGSMQVLMVPEEIRMGPLRFCYSVGQVVKVPRSVADRLEQKRLERQDQERRKDILGVTGKTKERSVAAPLWDQANVDAKTRDPNPFVQQTDQVGIDPLA